MVSNSTTPPNRCLSHVPQSQWPKKWYVLDNRQSHSGIHSDGCNNQDIILLWTIRYHFCYYFFVLQLTFFYYIVGILPHRLWWRWSDGLWGRKLILRGEHITYEYKSIPSHDLMLFKEHEPSCEAATIVWYPVPSLKTAYHFLFLGTTLQHGSPKYGHTSLVCAKA